MAAILFALAAAAAYVSVPVLHLSMDAYPQLFTAESWIRYGDATIDEYPQGLDNEVTFRGASYSSYPVGLALTASPALAPFVLAGAELSDAVFRTLWSRALATVLAAASVAFIYLACRGIAGPRAAFLATCAYAFGTGTWAVSSQELSQHSAAGTFLALGCWLATRGRAAAPRAALAFALASLTRPLNVITLGFGALNARRIGGWSAVASYVAWSVPPVAYLLTYNVLAFGSPSGILYGEPIPWQFPPPGLAGQLISPSRGLFVFSPVLLLAPIGMWLAWRRRGGRVEAFVRELSVAAAALWIAYASVGWWWGGWSYGNRYLLDAVPLLTLAAAHAIDRGALAGRLRNALFVLALGWSALLQFAGALYGYTYWRGYNWNATPSIDVTTERLWDWADAQWWSVLRHLLSDPDGAIAPALAGVAVAVLILRVIAVRTRTGYSAPAGTGGA